MVALPSAAQGGEDPGGMPAPDSAPAEPQPVPATPEQRPDQGKDARPASAGQKDTPSGDGRSVPAEHSSSIFRLYVLLVPASLAHAISCSEGNQQLHATGPDSGKRRDVAVRTHLTASQQDLTKGDCAAGTGGETQGLAGLSSHCETWSMWFPRSAQLSSGCQPSRQTSHTTRSRWAGL